MIYYLGLNSEIDTIRQHLDEQFDFQLADDLLLSTHHDGAAMFLIAPSVENPIRYVQQIVANDPLVSIIILAESGRYNQVKQSLLFSLAVGKNALCVVFNPSVNYSTVFRNAIIRTQQKRSFSKFNIASERKLSELTSPSVKLNNVGHILEYAPIGAILVTNHFKVIGANRASRKMFGQLNENTTSLEAIFSHNHEEVIKRIKSNEIEKSFTIEDQQGNFFEITSSSIPGEDAETTILLINDITERKKNSQRVSAIMEALPHIAWTADAEGNVNYYNHGWHNYTNKDAEEGMGEGWASIIHPADVSLLLSRWRESVRETKTFQHASRFRRFDGEYRWHLSKGTPILDKNKMIEMWVGTATDIHDQVLLNEELERKVKARTKLLEETNAELEQFAHISSHDLQEPLRKIQTFANIIKDEGYDLLNEQSKRYLDKIFTTSVRMSKLLKDLLNYSRINQQEPESIINLNEIIQHVQEDLELVITQNRASIKSDSLPAIKARPLQIEQMFYNIINNSLKYRKPEVTPVITIACRKLDNEKRMQFINLLGTEYWEIVIKDNGIGFDQRYAEQIFTVFQRLHIRSAYEGTGIGLAIAKKVIATHHGEIFAISSPGQGAEFHIILPALVEMDNA